MSKCNWPAGSGHSLAFDIFDKNQGWNHVGGIYIFTFLKKEGWFPLYVGQASDFAERLPNHERLAEAVRLGATHIHAAVVATQKDRDAWEAALIRHLQPQMNEQLK
jgi:excinuclease UvrABC nuclease subunit